MQCVPCYSPPPLQPAPRPRLGTISAAPQVLQFCPAKLICQATLSNCYNNIIIIIIIGYIFATIISKTSQTRLRTWRSLVQTYKKSQWSYSIFHKILFVNDYMLPQNCLICQCFFTNNFSIFFSHWFQCLSFYNVFKILLLSLLIGHYYLKNLYFFSMFNVWYLIFKKRFGSIKMEM